MRPFLAMVAVTMRQLSGGRRAIGFGLLTLLPAGLLLVAARAREAEGLDTDLGGLVVSPFLSIVVPVIALILAGAALGDERRDKTLSFLVLRPVRRVEIALAKTLAATGVSVGYALLGATALSVAYAAVGGSIGVFPSIFVGAALACVLYSAVFVLLGNLTTRPTLVGLVFVLFFENVMVDELPRLASASPWRIGLAATIDLMPAAFPARALLGPIGELPASLGNSLLGVGVTALLTVAMCALLLRRTDSV